MLPKRKMLTQEDWNFLNFLLHYGKLKGGTRFPTSYRYLAIETGMSRELVRYRLYRLRDFGFIDIEWEAWPPRADPLTVTIRRMIRVEKVSDPEPEPEPWFGVG